MKPAQLKTLVKNVIKEWQASVAEEKVPGTVYLDDLGIQYSPDERRVMRMAINTFSKGGHPMPDDKSVGFFGRDFVLQCLKKGEKLLAGKAKYAKDLAVLKALIPKLSSKVKESMTTRAELDKGVMKAVNLENETPPASERDLNDPKIVAHLIYQPVYLTQFVKDLPDGSKLYEILLHSASGPRHYIKQDKNKKWFYATRRDGVVTWNPADEYIADYKAFRKEKGLDEMESPENPDNHKNREHVWGADGFCKYCHNVHRTDRNARSTCSDGFGCSGKHDKKNPPVTEMSATGGVAGYSTPFAFSKNKKGSPRGIEAAKKYGKVVGEAPRV